MVARSFVQDVKKQDLDPLRQRIDVIDSQIFDICVCALSGQKKKIPSQVGDVTIEDETLQLLVQDALVQITYLIGIDLGSIDVLMQLLSQRVLVVQDIYAIKKKLRMPIVQQNRWQEIQQTIQKKAIGHGVDPEIIVGVWEEIHRMSCDIQTHLSSL